MLILQIAIVLGTVFVDLLTKGLAEAYLPTLPNSSLTVIEGVFNFTFTRNDGAAFSILRGQQWFFVLTASIACIAIVWFLYKSKQNSKVLRIGLCLMLGGTLGNLYDRIMWGSVRDMFDFSLINFPIFNVADCALCVGVALLVIFVIFIYKEPKKENKERKNEGEIKGEDDGE